MSTNLISEIFWKKFGYKKVKKATKIPLAKPEYEIKRLSNEEFLEKVMENLLSRTVNTRGFSQDDIESYVNIYWDICRGDLYTDSPISIKDIDHLFNVIIKEDNPSIYNKMRRIYNFSGEKPYSESKYKMTAVEVIAYLNKIRTVENALLYSLRFKKVIQKAIPKFKTNDEMKLSIEEYAKWSILWFIFFRDPEHFLFDFDQETGKLKNATTLAELDTQFFLPETMVLTEKIFKSVKKASISIDDMKTAIDSCKPYVRDTIYAWVQLDNSKYSNQFTIGKLRELKNELYNPTSIVEKEELAENTVEITDEDLDGTTVEITNEDLDGTTTEIAEENPNENTIIIAEENVEEHIEEITIENSVESISKSEYFNIVAGILEEATNDSTFSQKIANGEVTHNIVYTIFDMNDTTVFDLLYHFSTRVDISANEIFETLGISPSDFNFRKDFFTFNPAIFAKKVANAKKKSSPSPKDQTLIRIYNYLKEFDPICGNKKQKFSAYGI